MNIFAGVGKIMNVQLKGRVLVFNLFVLQKRPCLIPCVIFDPNQEDKDYVDKLQTADQFVWLKGMIISQKFEHKGKLIIKLEILTYANSVKPI